MSQMFREERDGTISLKLYGDPDAVRGQGEQEWTYIHTLSETAFQKLIEEGNQMMIHRGLKQMIRETA